MNFRIQGAFEYENGVMTANVRNDDLRVTQKEIPKQCNIWTIVSRRARHLFCSLTDGLSSYLVSVNYLDH